MRQHSYRDCWTVTHFVNVDGWPVLLVSEQVIVPHTDFTKVTGMVLQSVSELSRNSQPRAVRFLVLLMGSSIFLMESPNVFWLISSTLILDRLVPPRPLPTPTP